MDEKNRTKRRKMVEKTPKSKRKTLISPPKKRKKTQKIDKNTAKNVENSINEMPKKKKYVSKKRIKRRNRFLLVFSLIMLLLITLIVLSVTVFFPIKTIKITGSEKYNSEEIASVIGVVKGDNLLLASEKRANSAIEESYPYIEKIEFDKKLPFTLNVNVIEYEIYAQVRYGDGYLRVSKDGKILENSKKYKKGSPVVTGVVVDRKDIGNTISFTSNNGEENIFSKIDEITKAFTDSKIGGVTLINFSDMQDIRVTYNNKIVMLLGSSSNMDKKLAHAKATLEARGDSGETGTLNLSRIPSAKNEASFIPRELTKDEKVGK